MTGYYVTYSPASGKFTVTNLQTGKRSRFQRGYENTTDNLYPLAVLTAIAMQGDANGPVVFIGQDKNGKFYVVDSAAF